MNLFVVSISLIFSLFGFAGGGGSSSGGGGSSSSSTSSYSDDYSSSSSGEGGPVDFAISAGFLVIIIAVLIISNKKSSKNKLGRNYTKVEQELLDNAKQIFTKYQEDWSNFDTGHMKEYMTPAYYKRACLMMQALQNLHRQNRVSQLNIRTVDLMQGLKDSKTIQKVDVKYCFDGLDEVVDNESGNTLYSQKASCVNETWNFEYKNGKLLLDGIAQPTESAPHLISELNKFAQEKKMFYSADWGRYALPPRGIIFNKASMRKSDVNNHIIGQWKNILVQMYTYAQEPNDPSSYYIVGQLSVPKKYSGIIVKRHDFRKKIPKSYQQYKTEWQDFNKRYEVWATDLDKVASFELLNPKFMADLYDNDRDYNIEVVDDTIYVFAPVKNVTENDYTKLLDILLAAHHELKM